MRNLMTRMMWTAALVLMLPVLWQCDDGSSPAACGDNLRQGAEVCDGFDLAGATCGSLGFGGGSLYCRADCTGFSTAMCTAASFCGDNTAEGDEACDGTDLRGKDCVALGFGPGNIVCKPDCSGFVTDACGATGSCGDNAINGTDVCDGADLGLKTCESLGFGEGTLACQANCAGFDTSGCGAVLGCGNNNKEGDEVCDGSDFGDTTCASYGLEEGELKCSADCKSIDTSGCTSTCEPQCGEQECGPDPVCDQSCGECDQYSECSPEGKCERICDLDPIDGVTELNFDLQTVQIGGTITLNGAQMPNNTQQYYNEENRASLQFINKKSGDSWYVQLGPSGAATYNVDIFVGTYDVILYPNNDDYQDVLPEMNIYLAKDLLIDSVDSYDFNLRTVQIGGAITLNGAQMPNNTQQYYNEENRASLQIVNKDTSDSWYIQLGASGAATYNFEIFVGTYDILLYPNNDDYQDVLPEMNIYLQKDQVFDRVDSYDFNLQTVQIGGAITLNGADMPTNTRQYYNEENRASLQIVNKDTADSWYIQLGARGAATYNFEIFVGTYDILLYPNNDDYQDVLPEMNIYLKKDQVFDRVDSYNFDLKTVQIGGAITLNGAQMPNNTQQYYNEENRASLQIVNKDTADSWYIQLGASGAATYNFEIFVGTYDILLYPNNDDYQNVLPEMNIYLQKDQVFDRVDSYDFNLQTVQIGGAITLNGAQMPDNTQQYYNEENRASLQIANKDTSDSWYIQLGASGAATYNFEIFVGTYDILLYPNNDDYQNVLPEMNIYLKKDQVFDRVDSYDFDLRTAQVGGVVTLNGGTMPNNTQQYYNEENRASLQFVNKDTLDSWYIQLGASGPATYNIEIFEGAYDVLLYPNNDDYQDVLPEMNIYLRVGCTQ